jgi:FSR family fosmidomycin resistance protein-like MFS transporter
MRSRLLSRAVVVALLVEFVDELVDGTRNASLPLIRRGLALSYPQVGLLLSLPIVLGSLMELPLGVLAGYGARRHRTIRAGGALFVVALALVAGAPSFVPLLVAMVVFFPASGAFVGLTQAELIDGAGGRHERLMAAWTVAGSVGALAGPALLVAVGGWRPAFAVTAVIAAGALVLTPRPPAGTRDDPAPRDGTGLGRALRDRHVLRRLAVLPIADLLLDVLTVFVALYVVDVVHAGVAMAALAVAVRTAAGLAGEVVLVPLVERVPGRRVVVAGLVLAAVAYPAFLLAPGLGPKLALLAVLSVATAPLYPVLQADLYRSLPDDSAVVVTLSSGAALAGGAGPLLLGVVAARAGLPAAMAMIAAVPVILLAVFATERQQPR